MQEHCQDQNQLYRAFDAPPEDHGADRVRVPGLFPDLEDTPFAEPWNEQPAGASTAAPAAELGSDWAAAGGGFAAPEVRLPRAVGVKRSVVFAVGGGVALLALTALFSMVESPAQQQQAESPEVRPAETTEPAFLSPPPEPEMLEHPRPGSVPAPEAELAGMVPPPLDERGRRYHEVGGSDPELPAPPAREGSDSVDTRSQSYAAALRSPPISESPAAQQLRNERMQKLAGRTGPFASSDSPKAAADGVDPSIAALQQMTEQAIQMQRLSMQQMGAGGGPDTAALPSRVPASGPLRLTPHGPVPVGVSPALPRKP